MHIDIGFYKYFCYVFVSPHNTCKTSEKENYYDQFQFFMKVCLIYQ